MSTGVGIGIGIGPFNTKAPDGAAGGGGGFEVAESGIQTYRSSSNTSFPLPSTLEGKLIVAVVLGSSGTPTITGFSPITTRSASIVGLHTFYRDLDGGEGATATIDPAGNFWAVSWVRVTGAQSGPPPANDVGFNSGNTVPFGPIACNVGDLVLAVGAQDPDNSLVTWTGGPSGYTEGAVQDSGDGSISGFYAPLGIWYEIAAATSETPGNATLSRSDTIVSAVLRAQPI